MKKIKFTPRWGHQIRYDVLDDDEASQLAATYNREAYDRGDVDEYITIIPDKFEDRPDLLEYLRSPAGRRRWPPTGGGSSW